jgi:hypothetical protein
MASKGEISIMWTIRGQQLRGMVRFADSTSYEIEQRGKFPRRFRFRHDAWYGISAKWKHGGPRS